MVRASGTYRWPRSPDEQFHILYSLTGDETLDAKIESTLGQIHIACPTIHFRERIASDLNDYYMGFRVSNRCASYVGLETLFWNQDIELTSDASVGNILHEVVHSLGFLHEHQRGDRDRYVKIDADMQNDPNLCDSL